MWVCPSRGRPERLKAMLNSYEKTVEGKEYPLILLDADEPKLKEYTKVVSAWFQMPPGLGAARALNWAFEHADEEEKCFGFLADDIILETPGWNRILENAAGDWNISYPDDGIQHGNLSTFPCCGGKLLRALGWWALPGIQHNFLDTALYALGMKLGALRYMPWVLFEHHHFIIDLEKNDETYMRTQEKYSEDQYTFSLWKDSPTGLKNDVARIIHARSQPTFV